MSRGRGIVEERIGLSSQFRNKIGFQGFVNLHTYLGLGTGSHSDIAQHISYGTYI